MRSGADRDLRRHLGRRCDPDCRAGRGEPGDEARGGPRADFGRPRHSGGLNTACRAARPHPDGRRSAGDTAAARGRDQGRTYHRGHRACFGRGVRAIREGACGAGQPEPGRLPLLCLRQGAYRPASVQGPRPFANRHRPGVSRRPPPPRRPRRRLTRKYVASCSR